MDIYFAHDKESSTCGKNDGDYEVDSFNNQSKDPEERVQRRLYILEQEQKCDHAALVG